MSAWEQPDPAEVVDLSTDADWIALGRRYPNLFPRPFDRCMEVARACGSRTAVIETRYLDLDYRSEYSAFFSRTFATTPDNAHRIHFFTTRVSADQIWQLPRDARYVGYMIVRPSPLGRVGRTLLPPPPSLADVVQCQVKSTVHFFGQTLNVEGVPFAQQDTQFGRCAHVAAWVCHYSAVLRDRLERKPMADFSLLADSSVAEGRPLPSPGLTGLQLSNLLRDFGLPPIMYRMGDLPTSGQEPPLPPHAPDADPGTWDTRAIAVVCRFLNSGYPVLVGTGDHAFVLIGYRRDRNPAGRDWISLVRHDDQRGPYLEVDNILDDCDPATSYRYGPWKLLLAPVPDKLWLLPEAAERAGRDYLLALDAIQPSKTLDSLRSANRLTFRTYAIDAALFKEKARSRRLEADTLREYRLGRFSRMLWVVEAVDRDRRRRGSPAVLGEALFDSTSSDRRPSPLAVRVPGALLVVQSDGTIRYPLNAVSRPTQSAAATQP